MSFRYNELRGHNELRKTAFTKRTCSLIRGAFVPLSKMLNLVIGPYNVNYDNKSFEILGYDVK